MAFGNSSGPRRGFGGSFGGGNSGGNGGGNGGGMGRTFQRGGNNTGGAGGGAGGNDGRPRSAWTTVNSMYDEYHAAMEVQIVADFYKAALAIKLSPVFAERRGPENGQVQGNAPQRKYDYDNGITIRLELAEVLTFTHQLDAFINGRLKQVILSRGETKRLVLTSAMEYYDQSTAEFKIHGEGLAMTIEEDGNERTQANTVVFISRPKNIVLDDSSNEEVRFYPELQALLTLLQSYLTNCARVDFSSVRLLNQQSQQQEAGAVNTAAAPMPVRRGAAAINSAPATDRQNPGAVRSAGANAAVAETTVSTTVGTADIDSALGGNTPTDLSADQAAALASLDGELDFTQM